MKRLWESSGVKGSAIEFAAGWDNKAKGAYDNLLIPYDIKLNSIYSKELYRQGHISREEHNAIQKGLSRLLALYKKGRLDVGGHEDVHSLIESKLNGMYRNLAGNLHIGKSRNDQVSTVMRMWMRDAADEISGNLERFILLLKSRAGKRGKQVMPGYTHHRVAMPSTFGNLLAAYSSQLSRDSARLGFWRKQYNLCPLGAAAGYGSTVKLDRKRLAKELGFTAPLKNSIDAVTTRGEAEAALAFSLAVLLNHLSVIAHDLIYLSSAGIGVVSLPSEYCTGSSIMPQKKNPDVLEAVKAKASVGHGTVTALLSLGKGNISGYNRDTQWSKYLIIDLACEFRNIFDVMSGVISGVRINEGQSKKLLAEERAYSAGMVAKDAVETGRSFRKLKSTEERKIKSRGKSAQ